MDSNNHGRMMNRSHFYSALMGAIIGGIISACGTVGAQMADVIATGFAIAPYGGRIGPQGAPGVKRLAEVVGEDPGLAITATNTNAGAEAYLAGFMQDSAGNWRKIGATAWQLADPDSQNGFASWNAHTTAMINGASNDYTGLAIWGAHGAAFFPYGLGAQWAPGDGVLQVNGIIKTAGKITLQTYTDLFIDADGALKVRFQNGTVRTIATN